MTHGEHWTAMAVMYRERYGFSVIPMSREKKPTIKWKEFQDRRASVSEILAWPKENLAVVTGAISGIAVVDCDSRESAEWFWGEYVESGDGHDDYPKPAIVETKRGFHFYFQHPGERVMNGSKIEGKYDVRGDGGYVLAPPSRYDGGGYRWVKTIVTVDYLPLFKPEWRPPAPPGSATPRAIRDAEAYISKIPAISGRGGHNATFQAACVLRDAGLRQVEAMPILMRWSETNADPPWSEKELIHKLDDAYKQAA